MRWCRILLCRLIGCRWHRVQQSCGRAVCRDCGKRWVTWQAH